MTNVIDGIPTITIQRITAALVLMIVGFWLIDGLFLFAFSGLYLVFIIVTILVVRSVPVQPGHWLARQRVRRVLVSAIVVALAALTVSSSGQSTQAAGLILQILLALGFVLLGRATQRVASAPDAQVDEPQEMLRNRAHRLAYGAFALALGGTVLISYVASADSRAWLAGALRGGGSLSTFFFLLFFSPAMVLAWLEPDRLSGSDVPTLATTPRARFATTMIAIALCAPVVLSLALVVAPVRTERTVRPEPSQADMHCTFFDARTGVGLGFGAVIPHSAVACWDGTKAFESWGLNESDCRIYSAELMTVETLQCTRTTDADGTLHFVNRSRVRSAILPFITRDLAMELVLARDGRVVLWGGKSASSSSGTRVNMVETAEHRPGDDVAPAALRMRQRTNQRQGAVRPIVVVVVQVFGEKGAQMALADHDHVVEELSADTADKPFSHCIRPR